MKILFRSSKDRLGFLRGNENLVIDTNNCLFQPLVSLIDRKKPSKITIFYKCSSKTYLNVLKAIFHSKLTNFQLNIILSDFSFLREDVFFPISKIFADTAINIKKIKIRNAIGFKFLVSRDLPSFPHKLGFYIISDGKDLIKLNRALECIYNQDQYSVPAWIVGPNHLRQSDLFKKFPNTGFISDSNIYGKDLRFPISKKKNLIFKENQCERIVIMHDRIYLPKNWALNLLTNCSAFDIYSCQILAEGYRYLDKFSINFNAFITQNKNHYYLTYSEDNSNQFIDGGFFVLNRSSMGEMRFDERLYWIEMEDIDFVLRSRINCHLVTFDKNNVVFSDFKDHFYLNQKSIYQIFLKIYLRRFQFSFYLTHLASIFSKWNKRRII